MMNLFKNISIRIKIIVALVLSILIFIIGLLSYQYIIQKKNSYLKVLQKEELLKATQSVFLLRKDFLDQVIKDYACDNWMANFVEHPNLQDAKNNIKPISEYKLFFWFIYNLKQQRVYSDIVGNFNKKIEIPVEVFPILYKKITFDFYMKTDSGLLHVFCSTIHTSKDLKRNSEPKGYLFLGRLWDNNYLSNLAKLNGCNYKLVPAEYIIPPAYSDTSFIPLKNFNNKTIALLLIHKDNPFKSLIKSSYVFFERFFIITSLLILIIVVMSYNILVLKPLKKVTYSLNTDLPEKLIKIAVRGDEFGKIARLIIHFFEQREIQKNQFIELNRAKNEKDNLNHLLMVQKDELQASADELIKANEEIYGKNAEIVWQKKEIELQNQELTESINYSSIIQDAVMAIPEGFNEAFPEHFIIFKPRNILSGDFYWVKEHQGRFYIAGADCTGHSLAGALLSMLGISFLNDIIYNKSCLTAADILNRFRDYIVESLHQTGEFGEAHGGMDIVFCIIDPTESILQFAGAFNPLFYVTSHTSSGIAELIELKGDSMPIGIYLRNDPFTNHIVKLHHGDVIYVFSDGFIDQFGGPLNKKFLSKNFKSLLLKVSQKSMNEQKEILENAFLEWQGENPQTDDTLIIGIRYNSLKN